MPTPTNSQIISALYVATFNRAPDKAGLTYWEGQFTTNSSAAIQQLAAGFASHPAFTTLYGGLDNLAFVQAIYVNVLGGPGDAAGINFWNQALSSGAMSRSQFLAAFVESALVANFPNPALTPDENAAAIIRQDYLTNKADVGLYFANTLGAASNLSPTTDPNSLTSLQADPAYQASQAILAGVTNDDASVLAADQLINTASTQTDPAGYINDHALPPPGDTFTLTTGVDVVNASSPNAGDIVKGVVDPVTTSNSTYTNGDTVNGNGNTIVELTVASTGTAAVASLNKIADVNVVAGVAGSVNFNAVNWSSIGAVNLDRGADGLLVNVNNLEGGVDLSVAAGVSGSVDAVYLSGLSVDLFAGHASALSWTNTNVDATVAASESATFTAYMATGDVTVGNITAAVGKSGQFYAYVSSDKSGDIKVGNVAVTAKTGASSSVWVSNQDGGNVTVGNVSMLGGHYEALYVSNQTATGNVLVGNVALSVSASGSAYLDVTNTGIQNNSLGSLKVGNIDLTLGALATGSVDIVNSNSYSIDGKSLGGMTVGNMNLTLAHDATMNVAITQRASGTTGHALASFGDVAIGNLSANLGIGATMSYDVLVENSLSGNIGSVSIGNVSLAFDDGATASYSVDVIAAKGNIGSFKMGNVDVTLGLNASIDQFTVDLSAENGGNISTVALGNVSILSAAGTATGIATNVSSDYNLYVNATSGTVDKVTAGNFTAQMGPNAGFQYDASVTGYKGVNAVTFGNFDLTSHNAKSFTVDQFVSASNGNVGSVTVGNVSIAATGAQTAYYSLDVSASGTVGPVSVGNLSFNTTKDATIQADIYANGGAVDGNISLAGVSFNGTDSVGFNGSNLSINGSGDVSLGNVSVGLSITGITGSLTTIDLGAHGVSGLFTNVASTGDVSLNKIDYHSLVLKWAAGNPDAGNGVNIDLTTYKGNITAIGSQYNDHIIVNDGVDTLTGGAGNDTFTFNLNYTGKTAATLDTVTDFKSGADLLQFQVTGGTLTPTSYLEATYASFNDFLTGASTAMNGGVDNLVAGQVGSNVFVAVDSHDNNQIGSVIELTGANINTLNIADYAFV